jgi:hypothetical protein
LSRARKAAFSLSSASRRSEILSATAGRGTAAMVSPTHASNASFATLFMVRTPRGNIEAADITNGHQRQTSNEAPTKRPNQWQSLPMETLGPFVRMK